MSSEMVTIVNSVNEIIGQAPRTKVRAEGLIHRVTYILVFNAKQQILLQKRTKIKDIYPSYYDLAAGGVVSAGEEYEASAYRELHEELGLKDIPLKRQFDHYYDDGHNRYFGRVYTCWHNGPFKLQASEVQSAEFVNIGQIFESEFEPLTPDTFSVLEQWLEVNAASSD